MEAANSAALPTGRATFVVAKKPLGHRLDPQVWGLSFTEPARRQSRTSSDASQHGACQKRMTVRAVKTREAVLEVGHDARAQMSPTLVSRVGGSGSSGTLDAARLRCCAAAWRL